MKNNKPPIINILTFGLPFKLANQIFNEYQSRLSEAKYIIEHADRYRLLGEHFETVKILLAMTIFYKRVIANLDAAVKFHGTISRYSGAETIKIGSYNLTGEDKNKLLGLIINYDKLRERFGIPNDLNNYELTKEFLIKVLLLHSLENGENNKNQGGAEEDEFPF